MRELLDKFVFLVKNLRGVLAALPSDDLEKYVQWLSKRFRYRDLGVPPALVEAAGRVFEGRTSGNPFHILDYPTERVKRAAQRVAKVLEGLGLEPPVVEALLLASSYACPVLASERALERLRAAGLVVHEVRGPRLDVSSAKLHLRIADYSVLDYYCTSISEAVEAVKRGASPQELLEARRLAAERDAKRYWRIAGKGEVVVVAYVDYVHKLIEAKAAEALVGGEERVLAALLTAFNLDSAV